MSVAVPDDILDQYPHAADLVDDMSDTEFDVASAVASVRPEVPRSRCVVITGLPVVTFGRHTKVQTLLKLALEQV
jgi:hypothetical protein